MLGRLALNDLDGKVGRSFGEMVERAREQRQCRCLHEGHPQAASWGVADRGQFGADGLVGRECVLRVVGQAGACLGASVVVAAAILGNRAAGPGLGGALAAFPTLSVLLALVVAGRSGPAAGVHALGGLVRSLPCYLIFCVLAALTMPLLGAAAVPLALVACLAAGRLTWRALPAVTPSRSPA